MNEIVANVGECGLLYILLYLLLNGEFTFRYPRQRRETDRRCKR